MAKIIAAAPAERLLRYAGAKRVSDEAKDMLAEVMEEIAFHIAENAVQIARNCGRKTVTAADIKMVRI